MKKPGHIFYREFDHTADIGFELAAPSITALFEHAAWAMFDLILVDPGDGGAEESITISVTAETRDLLLREWLAELLYRHGVQKIFPLDITISRIEGAHLEALITAFPITEAMAAEAMEIKAVTYHGLLLRETDNGFKARVIFDA